MLSTIHHLREIARRCMLGQPLTDDQSRWLGASLQQFLTHRAPSVDDAFGLRNPRGGVPWWLEEAMRARDTALRDLSCLHCAAKTVSARANHIRTLAIRYAASAWRFDRDHEQMPAHYLGTPMELLWRAFKSGAPMPIGERQLRNILAR